MPTLFDLTAYHAEPTPNPDHPTYAEYLSLIKKVEELGDAEWLMRSQHWLFGNAEIFSELQYQWLFLRRERAMRSLTS